MRVVVITPPDPVVAWGDADKHLRLDGDTDQQTYVEGLIAAATANIDGPDGWLGRSLGVQTLEARLDRFKHKDMGACGLRLPCGPVIDIVSIQYVSDDGTLATVDPDSYEIAGDVVSPTLGKSWPYPVWQSEAVRVRYRAGYVTDPVADPLVSALPAPIKAAILLMVGDLFANRETTTTGTASSEVEIPMSLTVGNLLKNYRIWRWWG